MIDPNLINGEIVRETQHAYVVKKNDSPDEVIVCKYCGAEFDSYGRLSSHLRKEHPDVIKSNKNNDDNIFSQLFEELFNEEGESYIEDEDENKDNKPQGGEDTIDENEDDFEETKAKKPKRIKKTKKAKQSENKKEDEDDNIQLTNEEQRPKTPEEMMLDEMCEKLRSLLTGLPGVGSSNNIEWFINYFRDNEVLRENPVDLFVALKDFFPKAKPQYLVWVVKQIMKIKEEYSQSTNVDALSLLSLMPNQKQNDYSIYYGLLSTQSNNLNKDTNIQINKFNNEPSLKQNLTRETNIREDRYRDMTMRASIPQMSYRQDPMQTMMMQMFMNMMQMMMQKLFEERNNNQQQQQQQYIPADIIEKIVKAESEKKMLEMQLKLLKEQMKENTEMMKLLLLAKEDKNYSQTQISGEWRDDYAKLIAQLGSQTLQLASEIIKENKKTRQMLVKYVLPQILSNRLRGREPIEKELEPKGKTDEEIIEELEKEGYVEDGNMDIIEEE